MKQKGNYPFKIKPFPVGQGNPLPDAVEAHVTSLWLVSEEGKLVGSDAVLFLVSNTGADILIANNLLELFGILQYIPPRGYEDYLAEKSRMIQEPQLTTTFTPGVLDSMIRRGQCLMTIHSAELDAEDQSLAPKQKEPGDEDKVPKELKKEIRTKKIEEAVNCKVGPEPPQKSEITMALDLLKQIAENPTKDICSAVELEELQAELSRNRPEWAKCLTPVHTKATLEDAKDAKEQIEYMMDVRFKDTVFAKSLKQPCSFPPFEIKQKPGSAPEKTAQPRRFKDPKINQLIDEWVEGLLKDGLIKKSTTPVASPLTIVMKKGRDPRVCIDFRERNARTETPIFPMPDVHDFLDDAAGFKLYCSFDCTKMFNQYEIVERDRHLAAFITQHGTFEPTRILFGLQGGPQHAVRSARPSMREHEYTNGQAFTRWAKQQNEESGTILYEIDPKTGIVPGSRLDIFIDDCRIAAMTPKAMVKLCELWFLFCEEKRLILSRKKAKICHTFLALLGFVVSLEGKHLDPNRIASLLDLPTPTSKEGLHALLCSYNFVRMFVPNFSSIASPLYSATRGIIWKGPGSGRSKGTRNFDPAFQWTETLERCLKQLQDSLLKAPILAVPNYCKAIFLSVDACLKGEGWVLWQIIQNKTGTLVPVAIHYGSVKYGDSESTWEVTRQEAHAIQSALKDCYDYIAHCHFYLFTDHRNLTFLSDSVNRAVVRIRHFMQQFNMTVVHVPGSLNNPADGLSRIDRDLLPLQIASDLNSATTTRSLEEFKTTSQGTDPGDPSSSLLEETDRILYPSSVVLLTYGQRGLECPNTGNCLLCSPHTQESFEPSCSDSFHTAVETTLDVSNETQVELLPEEIGWDVVNHLNSACYSGSVLLTFDQSREAAASWNSKLVQGKGPRKLPKDDFLKNSWDEEWDLPYPTSLNEGFKASAKEPVLDTDGRDPHPEASSSDSNGVASIEANTSDQSTQTLPADFRSAKLNFPNIDDFKAIHNSEEGHHGLTHSYRKLMTRCGSGWAETIDSASRVRNDLRLFIEHCPICQKIRGLQDKIKAKHCFIISRPFIEVSYDFIVFEKPDKNGNRYIIVAVDNFTKLVELKARPDRGSEGVALFLLKIKSRYGPINRLRSDREKAFTSQVINRYNELAGTTSLPCVPYHPQANSVCERQNQIIMNHLRALIYGTKLGTDSMYSWTDLLPFVYSIVNNTPKMPLAISPLSMVYGIFANYDQPLLEPRPSTGTSNPVDYVDGLVEWQTKLLDIAEGIQSRHYEALTIKNKEVRIFHEGDFVLQLKKSTSISGKLVSRWVGPRLVLARRDNDPSHPVLDLYDLVTSRIHEASIEDCRPMKTGWFEEQTILQDMRQIAALDKEEYEVEEILEHRPPGNVRSKRTKPHDYWFKVKWAGFPESENSWEPYSNLKELGPLDDYLSKFPLLNLK
jgi:hypothetical protein